LHGLQITQTGVLNSKLNIRY